MPSLDPLIHQPVRLRVMSALASLGREAQVEFTYLRDLLELTDGNLGAHLRRLEEGGYVRLEKTFVERKPRTYVEATAQGREAFVRHVAALEEVIRGIEPPSGQGGES
ncbi:MAG: transcriptional regulator [Thermoanaerobaculia bacterium]|nr:transcriptional regulator [Thermoanaerobaculia bacterium]